jgi:hypothetical protein
MKRLLDIVNLNADASCLPAALWLAALEGGTSSRVHCWLSRYVELERKVVLGIVGATVADLRVLNPEVIELINAHPETFEIVLRPFAHDVALLRTPAGFARNLVLGKLVLERTFERVTQFYLPPEFMMSNAQVAQAVRSGVTGVFINASRFSPAVQRNIPQTPYTLRGVLGARLRCLPLLGSLTQAYLGSLHDWNGASWNRAIAAVSEDLVGSWRDGESWFFIPSGEERERAWLEQEDRSVQRVFVRDVLPGCAFPEPDASKPHGWCYPIHSFAEWFKESRMLGYLHRLQVVEQRLAELGPLQTALWLQAINSDVLSSVEKDSPVIRIVDAPEPNAHKRAWTIWRSARGFEGEEFLSLLESVDPDFDAAGFVGTSTAPHMQKLRARLACIEALGVP